MQDLRQLAWFGLWSFGLLLTWLAVAVVLIQPARANSAANPSLHRQAAAVLTART